MRTNNLMMTAAFVLTLGAAVTAAWMARHFYFRAKLAAAEPVALMLYAEENKKLKKSDVDGGRARPRVVLIGDSRIRAMRLGTLEPKWEIVNRGVNGETSSQMLIRFGEDALSLKPEVIIIQSGINDLVAGMGSDAMVPVLTRRTMENLKQMAVLGAAAGAEVMVLTVIPPAKPDLARRLVWSEKIRNEVAAVNRSLLDWNVPDRVRVLDLGGIFGSGTILPARYALDTLHLNQSGYAIIEETLVSLITSLEQ